MKNYLNFRNLFKEVKHENFKMSEYIRYLGTVSNKYHSKNLYERELYSIGLKYFSFVVLNYTEWIIENITKNNIDEVCFLSRDGYILKQCYDLYKENYKLKVPESKYIYASRSIFYLAAITDKKDWTDDLLLNIPNGQNIESYLNRWGIINSEAILKSKNIEKKYIISTQEDRRIVNNLYNELRKNILKNAQENRECLKEYWTEQGLKGKKVAFIDIGWNGSCQSCMEKILKELRFEMKPYFYFLGTIKNNKCKKINKELYHGCFFSNDEPIEISKKIFNGIPIIDSFFSAPHPYITRIEKEKGSNDFIPIYDDAKKIENIKYMLLMHRGAFEEIRKILDDNQLHEYSRRLGIIPLLKLIEFPTKNEVKAISKFKSSVSFGSERYNINIISKIRLLEFLKDKRRTKEIYKDTMWKKGFRKINKLF